MTTITKEQVEAQIKQYENAYRAGEPDDGSWDMDYTRSYISQLEANQRQPVSDEKLREAVRDVENTNRPASDCGYSWPLIKDAISELETLRAASKWQPTKGKLLNVIGTYLAFPDDGNIIEGLAEEIISQDWSQVNDQQRPTPPAQEVG